MYHYSQYVDHQKTQRYSYIHELSSKTLWKNPKPKPFYLIEKLLLPFHLPLAWVCKLYYSCHSSKCEFVYACLTFRNQILILKFSINFQQCCEKEALHWFQFCLHVFIILRSIDYFWSDRHFILLLFWILSILFPRGVQFVSHIFPFKTIVCRRQTSSQM
jgi:hypothetical protein